MQQGPAARSIYRLGQTLFESLSGTSLRAYATKGSPVKPTSQDKGKSAAQLFAERAAKLDAQHQLKFEEENERVGVKKILHRKLKELNEPHTAEELWDLLKEDVKSKRFMKVMLQQMKKSGWVKTVPQSSKHFGYILTHKWAAKKSEALQAVGVAGQAMAAQQHQSASS